MHWQMHGSRLLLHIQEHHMLRVPGREKQETRRTPRCTGDDHPKAKPRQPDLAVTAIDPRGMGEPDKRGPQKVGRHHEGTPDQERSGRNHRALHIGEDGSERDTGDQRNLADRKQLSQLGGLYCCLIVQWFVTCDLVI